MVHITLYGLLKWLNEKPWAKAQSFFHQKTNETMNLIQRIAAPTPKFFRVVRTVGLCLAAAGGALVASPIALPALIVAAGNYLIVAGSVATAVAQTAVESDNAKSK